MKKMIWLSASMILLSTTIWAQGPKRASGADTQIKYIFTPALPPYVHPAVLPNGGIIVEGSGAKTAAFDPATANCPMNSTGQFMLLYSEATPDIAASVSCAPAPTPDV